MSPIMYLVMPLVGMVSASLLYYGKVYTTRLRGTNVAIRAPSMRTTLSSSIMSSDQSETNNQKD